MIECFSLELTAKQTASLLKINRNTVNRYFMLMRKAICEYQTKFCTQYKFNAHLDRLEKKNFDHYQKSETQKKYFPVFGI